MVSMPPSAGFTQPPMQPLPPEDRPATKGDIAAVVAELQAIREVLEQIRDKPAQWQGPGQFRR